MRRFVLGALVGALSACNLLTGIGDLSSDGAKGCPACPDGGAGDGSVAADASVDQSLPDGIGETDGVGGFVDPTFGAQGLVTSPVLSRAHAVAVAADGRIIVLGQANSSLALMRFDTTGKPEVVSGISKLDLPFEDGTGGDLPNFPSLGAAMSFDSQGRLLVAGSTQDTTVLGGPFPTQQHDRYAFAARLDEGGLDTSFGNGGRYRSSTSSDGAFAIAPHGESTLLMGTSNGDAVVAWKLGADGKLVTTGFGANGRAALDGNGMKSARAAVASGAGALFAATQVEDDFGVAALGPDGNPLSGFGTAGVATLSIGPKKQEPFAIALSGEKIVVAGEVEVEDQLFKRTPQFGIARFSSNGTPDTTFGEGGKVVLNFETGVGLFREAQEYLRAIVVDAKSRIIVAGHANERPLQGADTKRIIVARLTPTGALDPLFGIGGRFTFALPNQSYVVTGMARQPDGKLVVVGTLEGQNRFFILRIVN